jgi:dihydropteroate synthase
VDLSTSHKMEGKSSRERKSELKRVSPPLAGVGEFICGRESKVKIMVEGKKRKRARMVLKEVG